MHPWHKRRICFYCSLGENLETIKGLLLWAHRRGSLLGAAVFFLGSLNEASDRMGLPRGHAYAITGVCPDQGWVFKDQLTFLD